MHIGSALLVIWLIIGGVAAGQRGDYNGHIRSCSRAGTIAVTILAGPLNYAREPAYQLHDATAQKLTWAGGTPRSTVCFLPQAVSNACGRATRFMLPAAATCRHLEAAAAVYLARACHNAVMPYSSWTRLTSRSPAA